MHPASVPATQMWCPLALGPPTYRWLGRYVEAMDSTQSVRQTATGRFSVAAWTGDPEALSQVVKLCRGLEVRAKKQQAEQLSETTEWRKTEHAKTYSMLSGPALDAHWMEQDAAELTDSRLALTLAMRATEKKWDREYSGDPDDVLREIDVSEVVKISLSLGVEYPTRGSGGISLQINFDRGYGCQVRTTAPTSEFVVLVDGELRPLLARHRPWYWWLRNGNTALPILAIPIFATALAWLTSTPTAKPITAELWILIVIALLTSTFGVGLLLTSLLRKMLPAFELLPTGRNSHGSKVLGIAFSVILWIVGTVVLPLALKRG